MNAFRGRFPDDDHDHVILRSIKTGTTAKRSCNPGIAKASAIKPGGAKPMCQNCVRNNRRLGADLDVRTGAGRPLEAFDA